ncbi:MAG: lectin [Acidobacteria bacterium]|nr:lectin [Acidobacteriota bacterium]
MKSPRVMLVAFVIAVSSASYLAVAQQPPAGRGQQPPQPMSFFVTSEGKGAGANLGGLAGADAHCQMLATAAGRGASTWRAYLSTQGPNAVSARDRIGSGPWFNARGQRVAQNVAEMHGDTIEQSRLGNALGKQLSLTEKNTVVNGVGDTPNVHDTLTGSQPDGRAYTDGMDHTCNNWTSDNTGTAQLGHTDKQGGGNGSWNSTHASRGCSQANLVSTGGAGLFYCFATN